MVFTSYFHVSQFSIFLEFAIHMNDIESQGTPQRSKKFWHRSNISSPSNSVPVQDRCSRTTTPPQPPKTLPNSGHWKTTFHHILIASQLYLHKKTEFSCSCGDGKILSQTIHKQIPRHLWFAQVCSGNNGQQACFAGHSAKAGSFQCKGLLLTPERPKKSINLPLFYSWG